MTDEFPPKTNDESIPKTDKFGPDESQESEEFPESDSKSEPKELSGDTVQQRLVSLEADGRTLRALVEGMARKVGTADAASMPATNLPPRAKDYKNRDDYLVARAKYELRQEDGQAAAQAQVEEARTRANETRAKFLRRAEAVRAKHGDFDEVLSNPALAASRAVVAVIREAEDGPELAYWLGKNLDEAERIASLSPARAALELGKISARLAMPSRRTESAAPDPVSTVSGLNTPRRDPNRMSMTDYRAWRESAAGRF